MFWVIFVSILGGGVPTFSKMALEGFQPFTFTLVRCVAAMLLLLPITLKLSKRRRVNLRVLLAISFLGTANVSFFALGVGHTTAIIAQILYAGCPVIAVVLSAIILKIPITRMKMMGIAIGFIGICIVIIAPGSSLEISGAGGSLLVLAAVICYAFYTVLSKTIAKDFTPIELTTAMVFTTILAQLVLVGSEIGSYADFTQAVHSLSAKNIIGVFYVGIVGTAVYFLLYQRVIRDVNPVYASMILYLQPVSAYGWSTILLNEQMSLRVGVGCVVTLIGAALVMKRKKTDTPFQNCHY